MSNGFALLNGRLAVAPVTAATLLRAHGKLAQTADFCERVSDRAGERASERESERERERHTQKEREAHSKRRQRSTGARGARNRPARA